MTTEIYIFSVSISSPRGKQLNDAKKDEFKNTSSVLIEGDNESAGHTPSNLSFRRMIESIRIYVNFPSENINLSMHDILVSFWEGSLDVFSWKSCGHHHQLLIASVFLRISRLFLKEPDEYQNHFQKMQ